MLRKRRFNCEEVPLKEDSSCRLEELQTGASRGQTSRACSLGSGSALALCVWNGTDNDAQQRGLISPAALFLNPGIFPVISEILGFCWVLKCHAEKTAAFVCMGVGHPRWCCACQCLKQCLCRTKHKEHFCVYKIYSNTDFSVTVCNLLRCSLHLRSSAGARLIMKADTLLKCVQQVSQPALDGKSRNA